MSFIILYSHLSQFYSHDIIEFIFILCTSRIVLILHLSHFNPFFNEIVVSRCETVCVNGVLPHVTDTNKLHENAPVWNFTLIWEGSNKNTLLYLESADCKA